MPEVVALDGFVGAIRLAPADNDGSGFVVLYELGGDPAEAVHNVHAASAAKQLTMSEALSMGPIPKMRLMHVYREYLEAR